MRLIKVISASLLSMLFSANPIQAGFTIDSGLGIILNNPPEVRVENLPGTLGIPASDTHWFIIPEKQNVLLGTALPVNDLYPEDDIYTTGAQFTAGDIPIGTRVSSYLIVSQRLTDSPLSTTYTGVIDFTNKIVGFQRRANLVEPSQTAASAQVALDYPDGFDVADLNVFPTSPGPDSFIISNNGTRFNFTFNTPSDMDAIRILIQTPEPETYLILGSILAIAALGAWKKKTLKSRL